MAVNVPSQKFYLVVRKKNGTIEWGEKIDKTSEENENDNKTCFEQQNNVWMEREWLVGINTIKLFLP